MIFLPLVSRHGEYSCAPLCLATFMSLLCLYGYVVFAHVDGGQRLTSGVFFNCCPLFSFFLFWLVALFVLLCVLFCLFFFPLLELRTKLRTLHLLANTVTLNSILSPSTLVLIHGLLLNLQFTDLTRLAVSEFRGPFASVCLGWKHRLS